MKHFRLALLDQPKSSWVLHDIIKPLKKHKNPDMPSAFYKFFPPPDADVHIKERYQKLCCAKCGKYDSDKVFKTGFEEPVAVRFKQDIAWTDDRQLVMNDKCLKVLTNAKVDGFESKPIGKSGWHVMRIAQRVDCNEKVYSFEKPICKACGQPADGGRSIFRERDISAPAKPNTFFTTKVGWAAMSFHDREVFLTEDVYKALKAGKIAGPYCDRLITNDEAAKIEAAQKAGGNWCPPGLTVYLSGK